MILPSHMSVEVHLSVEAVAASGPVMFIFLPTECEIHGLSCILADSTLDNRRAAIGTHIGRPMNEIWMDECRGGSSDLTTLAVDSKDEGSRSFVVHVKSTFHLVSVHYEAALRLQST
jgi:hypothetical protein